MVELKIKTESWPTRCEICHQTDCFSPEFNHCARCAQVNNHALAVMPHPDLDAFGRPIMLENLELDAQLNRRDELKKRSTSHTLLNLQYAINGSVIGCYFGLVAMILRVIGSYYIIDEPAHAPLKNITVEVFFILLICTGFGLIGGLICSLFEWLVSWINEISLRSSLHKIIGN